VLIAAALGLAIAAGLAVALDRPWQGALLAAAAVACTAIGAWLRRGSSSAASDGGRTDDR
jgi:cyanate permease